MNDAVATGAVVGILSRRDREYVASFDVSLVWGSLDTRFSDLGR